ncbi:MAG: YbaB/EbfC family nucleoid-associated protein [Chloroflexi bacterium]|nr:YbaB/EbfC family nucleoid-associated protein [Chloroflexota bacterium]
MNRHIRRNAARMSGQGGRGQKSQAQQIQAQLEKVQEELESLTVEGSSGGGAVKVVMSGKQVVESVTIDPDAMEDVELLQELIVAAVNDASAKTQETMAQKMGSITGGLNIPGLT